MHEYNEWMNELKRGPRKAPAWILPGLGLVAVLVGIALLKVLP